MVSAVGAGQAAWVPVIAESTCACDSPSESWLIMERTIRENGNNLSRISSRPAGVVSAHFGPGRKGGFSSKREWRDDCCRCNHTYNQPDGSRSCRAGSPGRRQIQEPEEYGLDR